jgi:hypothetical protein
LYTLLNSLLFLEHKLRGIVFYILCPSMVSLSTVPAPTKNKALVSDFFLRYMQGTECKRNFEKSYIKGAKDFLSAFIL